MNLTKKDYSEDDLIEIDKETAPSLDFPNLVVEKVCVPKDGGNLMVFYMNVKRDWIPEEGCPFCKDNFTDFISSGRNKPRVLNDISRNNKCIIIVLQAPRLLCKKCGERFTPDIPGLPPKVQMTERLIDFIKVESFLQPFSDLEQRTGVSTTTISDIMDKEIERIEQERLENPIVAPTVLGIDEKHIVHAMRGTLVDVENSKLLDMLPGNSQVEFKEAITKLKDWDKNIKVVTIDMNNSYLHWMPQFLPNATFVIDKFHVFQDVNQKVKEAKTALYEYRKNLIKSMEDKEEKRKATEILRIINDNNRLFNYSTNNLESNNGEKAFKLATVVDAFPEFALLRKLYATVELMYAQNNRDDAKEIWDQWQELLPPATKNEYKEWCIEHNVDSKCFEAFRSLKRIGFTQFEPYILNYFNPGCRFTNAATEGLNNLIGTINSSGNGYQFRHLRAKCLYASLIHEKMVYSISSSKIASWKPTTAYTTVTGGAGGMTVYIDKMVFKERIEKVNINQEDILNNPNIVKQMLESDSRIESLPTFELKEYEHKSALQKLLEEIKADLIE